MAIGGGNLADQVVNSALRYRAQAPLLDSLMREVGIDGSNINGLTNVADVLSDKASVELKQMAKPVKKTSLKPNGAEEQ